MLLALRMGSRSVQPLRGDQSRQVAGAQRSASDCGSSGARRKVQQAGKDGIHSQGHNAAVTDDPSFGLVCIALNAAHASHGFDDSQPSRSCLAAVLHVATVLPLSLNTFPRISYIYTDAPAPISTPIARCLPRKNPIQTVPSTPRRREMMARLTSDPWAISWMSASQPPSKPRTAARVSMPEGMELVMRPRCT